MKIILTQTQISTPLRFSEVRFKNFITKKEVFDFKENYCDENEIIIELLRGNLNKYLKSTILDVGSGIGDIAFKALGNKRVIMIDVNDISKRDYPCRSDHVRLKCDFFKYKRKERITTLLVSHTLQFIDNDVDLLNNKVNEISPDTIVLIVNENTDFLGVLIDWSERNCDNPNPERKLIDFPKNYSLDIEVPFRATLRCPTFEILAEQVSYLMLIDIAGKEASLISFLQAHLTRPEFFIHQSIEIYKKNGQ